ncbi:hypothetical protein SAMN02800694_3295 [Luteibacter sp. UNCMF331Sha3.1]|uniref:hypothetical protein n=1 Tax=Luteibacter sp. UNCMF331Sha3.1 TaxID=1502760 RepID=UPI0008BD2E01|nr:hypothetical protein [Luteibacter sp. UNCMF331Sha3.1]SEN35817.1 hypothetical protein SAMN02800694_3295 [Luteibacter sp. UNCMF331Sha3.1]
MLRHIPAAFALFTVCASVHAADLYKVDMSVLRGGVVVARPSVRVAADKIADLTMTPPGGPEKDAVRVALSVAPGTQSGTVAVHLMIFERPAREWTLRAEPVVVAWPGREATLEVGGNKDGARDATIGVTLTVTAEMSTPAAVAAAGS